MPFESRKRKRDGQRAERVDLGDEIDLFGEDMPLPCSSCLLLNFGKEEDDPSFVVCRMDKSHSRCGECARTGKSACDATGLDHSDCMLLSLFSCWLLTFSVLRVRRALDKAEQDEAEALRAAQAAMARLDRARKQKDLLKKRGSLMIAKKASTVEELEELDRLETAREAGDSADPENAGEERSPKRLRGEPSADNAVGLSQSVGSPGAGSDAAPPESSELVNQARQPLSPGFDFGPFLNDASAAWVDLGFGDGTHQ